MKTLLMTVFMGMTVRNILQGDVYRKLQDRFRLIIVTPYANNSEFLYRFSRPNVVFADPFVPKRNIFLENILYRLQYYAMWHRKHPATAEKYILRDRVQSRLTSSIYSMGGRIVNAVRGQKEHDWMRDFCLSFDLSGCLYCSRWCFVCWWYDT